MADESPDAFATVVDRLLASPHYGERWGRHWLDVVHYADTHGFESDRKRPDAWRYRDYVIDAFNRDKPFDRFLSEQIAGDALDPSNPEAIAALGFLGTGPWDKIGHEAVAADLRRRARADELDDIVNTVAATTLGLTLNCARCHDHKFDPLPQRDYYRMAAVFAGVKHGERSLRPAAGEERTRRLAELKVDLARIKAELGRIDRAPLDLADIVAGGNGFGSGERERGIDPRSGEASSGKLGILPGLQVNKFTPSQLPLVDGVVIPSGAAPISSTGIVIQTRATDGQSWDYIQAGKVLSQDTAEIDGVDYAAARPHDDRAACQQSADVRSGRDSPGAAGVPGSCDFRPSRPMADWAPEPTPTSPSMSTERCVPSGEISIMPRAGRRSICRLPPTSVS